MSEETAPIADTTAPTTADAYPAGHGRIDDLARREGTSRAAWVRRLLISAANSGAAA